MSVVDDVVDVYDATTIYDTLFKMLYDDKDADTIKHKRFLQQYHSNPYDRDISEYITFLDIWCVLYDDLYANRLSNAYSTIVPSPIRIIFLIPEIHIQTDSYSYYLLDQIRFLILRYIEDVNRVLEQRAKPHSLYWEASDLDIPLIKEYTAYAHRILWFYMKYYRLIQQRLQRQRDTEVISFQHPDIAQVRLIAYYLAGCSDFLFIHDPLINSIAPVPVTTWSRGVSAFTEVLFLIEEVKKLSKSSPSYHVYNPGLIAKLETNSIYNCYCLRSKYQYERMGNKLTALYLLQDETQALQRDHPSETQVMLEKECIELIEQDILECDPDGTLENPPQAWIEKRKDTVNQAIPLAIRFVPPMFVEGKPRDSKDKIILTKPCIQVSNHYSSPSPSPPPLPVPAAASSLDSK